MGRVKALFCAFCFDKNRGDDHHYSQTTDVSHLATPHVSQARLPETISPIREVNEETHNNDVQGCDQHLNSATVMTRQPTQDRPYINPDNSPPRPSSSSSNNTQQPPSQAASNIDRNTIENRRAQIYNETDNQRARSSLDFPGPSTSRLVRKLSYGIISVREPIAKILAEREQRQVYCENEYIEVSSCLYEEIAGSSTSSATYDQIGAISNHNYQVLANAYAAQINDTSNNNDQSSYVPIERQDKDTDDNTKRLDQVDAKQSTSSAQNNDKNGEPISTCSRYRSPENVSQSVPVYSVINKATKMIGTSSREYNDRIPPRPPPKNAFLIPYSGLPNAIHYQSVNTQFGNNNQINSDSSSSYQMNNHRNYNDNTHSLSKMPEPPPRLSKQSTVNVNTNRPLPLPEGRHKINDDDDDDDTASNGYELLSPVFDEDQVDVGYEKIRETDRHSRGSLASQIYNIQALENNGYESVHPIYSSPSSALVEPNYEAIGPATASELAAAATARLNAAVRILQKDTTI